MKHVGVFVNVANLYTGLGKKYPGRKLDYRKYRDKVAEGDVLARAVAYGLKKDTEADRFISSLKHIGYDTRYRNFRRFEDKQETGETVVNYRRVDLNLIMSLDIVRCIDRLHKIVLGTSDPEIVPLIEWIKEKGVEVKVVSIHVSRDIRNITTCEEITEDLLLPEVK